MENDEISSIFTLERKGSLDRDISVITAVSVDYLNSLLADIVRSRNEASSLYAHINEQNYDLSVNGMLNTSETIRQLYDNLASLKNHMLQNDQDMQIQLDKLNYYMYNSSTNNDGGYDILGKVEKLINKYSSNDDITNRTKQTLYKFNDKSIKITAIPAYDQNNPPTLLSNVFLSVQAMEDYTQEIIFSGKGQLGIYKETSDRVGCDNYIESLNSRTDSTIWIPCKNLKDGNYVYDKYVFSSPACNEMVVTQIIHPVQQTQIVMIDNSISNDITNTVSVYLSAYPDNYGYTEGNGIYDISSYVKITAKPYSSYEFDHWAVKGYPISAYQNLSANSYRIRANIASNYVAVFKKIQKPSLNISANVNHDGYGKVYVCDLSGNPYLINESLQAKTISVDNNHYAILLKSEPKNGYKFVKWHVLYPELSSEIRSFTNNPLRWDMSAGHRQFTAEFAQKFKWKLEKTCGYNEMVDWQKSVISKGYELLKIPGSNVPTYPTKINMAYVKSENDGRYSCYLAVNS